MAGRLSELDGAGRAGLDAIVADPAAALLAFDYDGTLAPIVDDPTQARVLPGVVPALAELARRVGRVAIVTGRPAAVVVELARLEGAGAPESLVVLGQYGLERWDAATLAVTSVGPPAGLDEVRRELPALLAAAGVEDADVEDKGLAVAVHVRQSRAPQQSFSRIRGPLGALAERTGLVAEPGRLVVELRPPGMDKGKALLALADEVGAGALAFTGDDLGDLAAFDAVDEWRSRGRPGLLVCSGSDEVSELAARADLVVDGPAGVLDLLRQLPSLL